MVTSVKIAVESVISHLSERIIPHFASFLLVKPLDTMPVCAYAKSQEMATVRSARAVAIFRFQPLPGLYPHEPLQPLPQLRPTPRQGKGRAIEPTSPAVPSHRMARECPAATPTLHQPGCAACVRLPARRPGPAAHAGHPSLLPAAARRLCRLSCPAGDHRRAQPHCHSYSRLPCSLAGARPAAAFRPRRRPRHSGPVPFPGGRGCAADQPHGERADAAPADQESEASQAEGSNDTSSNETTES